jgi:cytochrome b involved in lipid metabolism
VLYAKQNRKYIVFYEEKVLDISQFIYSHPGGKKVLISYIYKDITASLFTVFKHHRETTLTTLAQFIIGTITPRKRINTYSPKTSLTPHK